MDLNVEAVAVDEMVLPMNAWEDQFTVVRFNNVDGDAGKFEANFVQIEFMYLDIIQLETN